MWDFSPYVTWQATWSTYTMTNVVNDCLGCTKTMNQWQCIDAKWNRSLWLRYTSNNSGIRVTLLNSLSWFSDPCPHLPHLRPTGPRICQTHYPSAHLVIRLWYTYMIGICLTGCGLFWVCQRPAIEILSLLWACAIAARVHWYRRDRNPCDYLSGFLRVGIIKRRWRKECDE